MGKSQWNRQNYFQIEVEFSAQKAVLQDWGVAAGAQRNSRTPHLQGGLEKQKSKKKC
jgi:hypothetical protein